MPIYQRLKTLFIKRMKIKKYIFKKVLTIVSKCINL